MKNLILFFVFTFFSPYIVNSQITTNEIDKIVRPLVSQLNAKKVKKIGVADFTYLAQKNTRIGKFIADEVNMSLAMNGAIFNIADRKMVRTALYGTSKRTNTPIDIGILSDEIIDIATNEATETRAEKRTDLMNTGLQMIDIFMKTNNKKLKGVDVIIAGDIEDIGDYLNITITA
ncbi:MAG: hypothetical protein AAFP82_19240, partial [Bacteroidota bacterium]